MKALDEALNYIAATEGGTRAHFLDDHPEAGEKLLGQLEVKDLIFYKGDGEDTDAERIYLTQAGQLAFRKADK